MSTPLSPAPAPNSPELAADKRLFELWDFNIPFPPFDQMPDLDVVTHVNLEKATAEGYHYLHESAIALYRGALYVCWANHPQAEVNVREELIRGSRSIDGGMTWSAAETWVASPDLGAEGFNHPVLATHQGRLWGFFTAWSEEKPRTEVFSLDDVTGKWGACGGNIPGFIPFHPPMKMRDGNWIMAGEEGWTEAAVAISTGDDFTRWQLLRIPRPQDLTLLYPETALIDQGDRILAVCRPRGVPTAPTSFSTDCGRTWQPLTLSNFPLKPSQPFAGLLSTGQHYLITDNLEEGRALLSIAVTAPGGRTFRRIWKIRHQQFPRRRLLGGRSLGQITKSHVGTPTEWSYPAAIEHEGKLFVSYTHGKEDCVLSIIPIRALAVKE